MIIGIEQKGTVRLRVLINLLDCMDFKMSEADVEKIKDQFCANNITLGGKAQ